MDKVTSAAIVIGVLVLALGLMALGWRNLRRRQSSIPAPASVPADLGTPIVSTDGLYVSSTKAGEPLSRIAVHGLGFRSRSQISVSPEGIVFSVKGRDDVFIPVSDVVSAGRATYTIDKAVEAGGLAVVTWQLGDIRIDSNFRVDDTAALHAGVDRIISTRTGSDAQ